MSIINKRPELVKREYELEDIVALDRRKVRHVHRKHAGSCREFGSEDPVVQGQAVHELEKAATARLARRMAPHAVRKSRQAKHDAENP